MGDLGLRVLSHFFKGHVCMAVVNAYVDEHCTGLVCAAAYIFEKESAEIFRREWAPYLADKGLVQFHAAECFHRADWDEISATLIELIAKTARHGVVRFVEEAAMHQIDPNVNQFIGSPYSLCVLSCMERVAHLARSRNDEVIYFIEDGNQFAGEVRHFINQIKDDPVLIEKFGMKGADTWWKADVIQLQSADLLAWVFGRSYRENIFIEPLKKLFDVLDHYVSGFSETSVSIQAMVNSVTGLKSNRTKFDFGVVKSFNDANKKT
jgi:hypothetical protein